MRYALGIDGGGSKCDAVLIDENGTVTGWGRGGPTHPFYDSPQTVAASYAEAVSRALDGLQQAEIWVGGHFPPGPVRDAIAAAGRIIGHRPAGEVEMAFASAQRQWGIIVLAGTGSFVFGRTAEGRTIHAGGLGPVLGDYGSAYSIGLLGLRAAFASRWAQARSTTLAQALPQALGADSLRAVFDIVYQEGLSRRQIASLARVVDQQARAGDRIAIMCLKTAADQLADIAVDVINELDMHDIDFPLIAVGSVAQCSHIWWEQVCRRLTAIAPGAFPIVPVIQPATAAALLALREMGLQWTPELIARITETQQPFLDAIQQPAESVNPPG